MWSNECSGRKRPQNKIHENDFLECYEYMSFYIAKVLKINPYEILNEWSPSQIIVAFGNYANEKSEEAHYIWETNPDKTKRGKEPKKYFVEFVGTYKVGE